MVQNQSAISSKIYKILSIGQKFLTDAPYLYGCFLISFLYWGMVVVGVRNNKEIKLIHAQTHIHAA